jgi:F-type H+-transporting ATPase subunit delta
MKGALVVQSKISYAYARGFFSLLMERDQKLIDKVYKDFELLLYSIGDESSQTYKKLVSPLISNADRAAIIGSLSGDLEKLLIDFLTLLIEKNRLGHIYEIYEACLLLRDESNGIVRGEVRVAEKPDKDRQDDIIRSLSKITGKKVLAEFVEDETVIAGFITLMGNHYIDYSLSSHLKQMETELNRS